MHRFKLVPTLALSLIFGLSAAMAVQAAEGNRSLLTKDVKIKPSRPDSEAGQGRWNCDLSGDRLHQAAPPSAAGASAPGEGGR